MRPRSRKFGLCMLLMFLLIPSVLAQLTPIARWDVVPYQRIDQGETFNAGVVAFSKEGINRVEFDIVGGGFSTSNCPGVIESYSNVDSVVGNKITVSEMTLNDRVGVWEYWAPIPVNCFGSDGVIEINATVVGNDGGVRRSSDVEGLGLDPLILNVYPIDTSGVEAWVSVSASGPSAVNDPLQPFATIYGAAVALGVAEGSGSIEGATIYLEEGDHLWDGSWGGAPSYHTSSEWVTVRAASGASKANVRVVGNDKPWKNKLTKVEGITFTNPTTPGGTGVIWGGWDSDSSYVWSDNNNHIGIGHLAETCPNEGCNTFFKSATIYLTNDYIFNVTQATVGNIFSRNLTIEHIGGDAFVLAPLVIDSRANDIDPNDGTCIAGDCFHADCWQWYGGETDTNLIIYNYKCTNYKYQGLMIRGVYSNSDCNNRPPAEGIAIVNLYLDKNTTTTCPNCGSLWMRDVNHFLIWGSTFRDHHLSFYDDGACGELYDSNITNFSVIGSIFNRTRFSTHGGIDTVIDWSGWESNHFGSSSLLTPGSDISVGDPLLDAYGVPQNTSLHDRVSPLVVKIDADNNLRSEPADLGAYEYLSGVGECSVNQDCDDSNACTGDRCESGTCEYTNYNLDGSETIGLGDIIHILLYWGKNEGEPGWNPAVDLDGNGNIGLLDIMVLLNVWGEYC